jgi:hypothetical protein
MSGKSVAAAVAVIAALTAQSMGARAESDDPGFSAAQSAVRDAHDSIYSRDQAQDMRMARPQAPVVSRLHRKLKMPGSVDRAAAK